MLMYGLLIEKDMYQVVSVIDGDTIKVLIDNKETKVRLKHIDAPEKKQDFYQNSKSFLSKKVFGKYVILKYTGKDRYGRILAEVFCDSKNINLLMVEEGLAWHYKKFSKDIRYARREEIARNKEIGIWSKINPIPPWEFRK